MKRWLIIFGERNSQVIVNVPLFSLQALFLRVSFLLCLLRVCFAMFRFFRSLDGALLFKMRIVCISQVTERISIIQKCDDEPYEQCQRNYDGHDQVLDLMFQVHEISNNVKCFGHHQNNDRAFYCQGVNRCLMAYSSSRNPKQVLLLLTQTG
jgi:hypothetical protein